MDIKELCVITSIYPTEKYPGNTFLDQLVCRFADIGIHCTVIAPYSPLREKLTKKPYFPEYHRVKITKAGSSIDIYSPRFFGVTGKKFLGIDFASIWQKQFYKQVEKTYKKIGINFDAVYGHFIVPSGLTAAAIGKKYNKPSFIAYGESSLSIVSNNFDLNSVRSALSDVSGIVSVSSDNKRELIENNIVDASKIEVFPNAIDSSTFYVMDKAEAREKLNIAKDDFVVAFVGHYIHRKGSRRLSSALSKLDNVKSIFIGSGEEAPTCDGVLFSGRLPHDKIVEYLNAADVFVLPTLAEGCCNAIVEAMACGLPIISSDLPFNDDILDDNCSIRIDPNNVDDIAAAIRKLKDDIAFREQLSKGALQRAKLLTIEERASNIIAFLNGQQ